MADTISNDEALALLADGNGQITAGAEKLAAGQALVARAISALKANLAAPPPVDPKPVDPKPPSGTRIDSTAALLKALETAKGGDVLLLEPGDYGLVRLRDLTFDGQVTIASRNLADLAVLTGLTLNGCAGLTFRDLHLDYSKPWAVWNTQVTDCRSINLLNLHAHGSKNGYPGDDQNAALIRNSTGVRVAGSEFYEFAHAVSTMGGGDISIDGNSFHDLRSDGVMCAGTSNIRVVGNAFTDFFPADGDHPDAIQFLTRGTTGKAHDIVVTGNLIVRGAGGIVQGVFITDQILTGYERVTVTDNVVLGGMYNGIMISNVTGAVLASNHVAGYADQKSWIRVNGSNDVSMSGNRAMTYILEKNGVMRRTDDATVPSMTVEQIADLDRYLKANANPAVAALRAVLGKAPQPAV